MNARATAPVPAVALALGALLASIAATRLPPPPCGTLDPLLPLAVLAACEPRGRLLGPVALGLVRDALTAAPPGLFAAGYLLAGGCVAAGAGRRPVRSLRRLASLLVLATPLAYAPACGWALAQGSATAGVLGRELGATLLLALLLSPLSALPALALATLLAPARALRRGY